MSGILELTSLFSDFRENVDAGRACLKALLHEPCKASGSASDYR